MPTSIQDSTFQGHSLDFSVLKAEKKETDLFSDPDAISQAYSVLSEEAASIVSMRDRLSEEFCKAVELIIECPGKVVVTGHGQVRAHRQQNSRNPRLHRHPSIFRPPSRASSRRLWHDRRKRHRHRLVCLGRNPGNQTGT